MILRRLALALFFVAIFAFVSTCNADIIGNTLAADGDGVITCAIGDLQTLQPENGISTYQIDINGIQCECSAGHIQGDITAKYEDVDPKLTLAHSIDNDTGYDWGDYHVQVKMSKAFTFDNVSVANLGWTVDNITQPTLVGSLYVGSIDYIGYLNPVIYDSNPLLTGTLDFSYRVTYVGSSSFCEQLTPSPVPEPTTMVLSVLALLGVAYFARQK